MLRHMIIVAVLSRSFSRSFSQSELRVCSESECDEYIQIFEYSNILVTNIYSDIRSNQFFFYEYIRTFVRVKFVCTNIFGHSLVSVLECKT